MSNVIHLQSGTAVVIDDLVKAAYDALADGHVTFGEVVHLGGLLAGKVSRFVQLSGAEKKEVVLAAVEKGLEKVLSEKVKTLPEGDRETFEKKIKSAVEFVKQVLPSVLELVVSVAKGKLEIANVKKTCLSKALLTLRCISRQVPQVPVLATVANLAESALGKKEDVSEPETKTEQVPPASVQVDLVIPKEETPKPEEGASNTASEQSQKEVPSETQEESRKE